MKLTSWIVKTSLLPLALSAGCVADEQTDQVELAGPNDLGIATLHASRGTDGAGSTFLLRALTADAHELASVQLTTGPLAKVTELALAEGEVASKIDVSISGITSRAVTRETHHIALDSMGFGPAAAHFLELPSVSAALGRANISIEAAPADDGERPYQTNNCTPSQLNTTPIARECCSDIVVVGGPHAFSVSHTIFHRDDQVVISRVFNMSGGGCKANDGVSSCNGTDCFYGPFRYSKPVLFSPPPGEFANTISTGGIPSCSYNFNTVDPAPTFGDVTGTNPTGQGCPGGDEGYGQWDY